MHVFEYSLGLRLTKVSWLSDHSCSVCRNSSYVVRDTLLVNDSLNGRTRKLNWAKVKDPTENEYFSFNL